MNTNLSEPNVTKVEEILMQQLAVERSQITPKAAIMADLGADSLDIVEIGMAVEEAFNITIQDEEMEKVVTVSDLCETLASLLEQTAQPG